MSMNKLKMRPIQSIHTILKMPPIQSIVEPQPIIKKEPFFYNRELEYNKRYIVTNFCYKRNDYMNNDICDCIDVCHFFNNGKKEESITNEVCDVMYHEMNNNLPSVLPETPTEIKITPRKQKSPDILPEILPEILPDTMTRNKDSKLHYTLQYTPTKTMIIPILSNDLKIFLSFGVFAFGLGYAIPYI
jgi:hypothetical protein